jgi:hypothetical protein
MAGGSDWKKDPLSYELEICTLVNNEKQSFDIRHLMLECNIYESITNNFLVGEIAIADAIGFLENAKIFGQESLHIKFKQPPDGGTETPSHNTINQIFRIYKVSGIHRIGQNTSVYKLHFCAPELIQAKRIRISEAHRGTMVKIAGRLAKDNLGIKVLKGPFRKLEPFFEFIVPSQNEKMHVVIPNWTVNFAINWLLQQAQGIDSKSGLQDSFFFFQTARGSFRIQSIADMFKTKYLGGEAFYYAPAANVTDVNLDKTPKGFHEAPEKHKAPGIGAGRRILDYTIGSSANVLEGTMEGLFAQKQITIDNTHKYQTEKTYNYLESFHSSPNMATEVTEIDIAKLGQRRAWPLVRRANEVVWVGPAISHDEDVPPKIQQYNNKKLVGMKTISSYPDAHTTLTSDSSFVNDDKNVYNQATHNTHLGAPQFRTALRQLLKYYTMNVLLPSRTDISVGQLIQLDIPATRGMQVQDMPALFHTGHYLITEIKWSLTKDACRTNIKVIKDSFINDIETTAPEYVPKVMVP